MSTRPFKLLRERSEQHIHAILLGLAFAFVLSGCITLYLAPYPASLTTRHLLILIGGWTASWFTAYWTLRKRLHTFDPYILSVVAFLTGWGLLLQARLAPSFMVRQVIWLAGSCAVLVLIACNREVLRLLKRYRYSLLTAGLILLSATLVFGVNPSGYGQRLWLGAFGIYLQPSEMLKLLLVIYLAAYLADNRHYLDKHSHAHPVWLVVIGPMLVMVGVALVLVGWQQDLGAALLFYLTATAMLYLAWGKLWHVLLSLTMFIPVAIAGYMMSDRVALRVSIWLDPWAPEQADRAFQILQSLYAFSAGGIVGEGLGHGLPTLIPAVHTDFIYAALAEEFGLFGAFACLSLFALLIYRGVRLAQKAETPFGSMLAGGISALIAIQVWVITAGNIKLIPITGVTLPFVSYGGSSLITVMIASGLLINISGPYSTDLSIAPEEQHINLTQTAGKLGRALLILMLTVLVFTGQWSFLRADELRVSTSNPRFILGEARIQRGTIFDRNAGILATNEIDELGYITRVYPLPEAAPVVGYATLEYGTQEIEETCNSRLRGEINLSAWDHTVMGLRHETLVGYDVRVTLDAALQKQASDLLQDQTGAIVLVDARSGEILALASSPIYDPNTLLDDWDELIADTDNTPLLNRATQGLAQPGSIIQTIVLASILESGDALPPPQNIGEPYQINGTALQCRIDDVEPGWNRILAADCVSPVAELASTITQDTYIEALSRWGLLDAPVLSIPTVSSDWQGDNINLEHELIGQGDLLVTPLQMAQVAVIVANDGQTAPLHILMGPQTGCAGYAGEGTSTRVISPDTTARIRALWYDYGNNIGDSGISIAGENRSQVWFIGLGPDSTSRYAIAVFLDKTDDSSLASDMGNSLLRSVNQR